MKQERSVTISNKIESFFEKNYALVFTAVLLLMTYLVALFNYKAWPFSDKYTLASYDLSAQICPFIEHLFDVIQGKSSLFYTYAIAGGTDIVGTYLYFFISPFSLLFLITELMGKKQISQFVFLSFFVSFQHFCAILDEEKHCTS